MIVMGSRGVLPDLLQAVGEVSGLDRQGHDDADVRRHGSRSQRLDVRVFIRDGVGR